jgi:hypothetical protein
MSGSHHPPGTLILEPQVVITTGQSGAVQVKRAYQTLPQYPIAYPGMCPPHQQNAGELINVMLQRRPFDSMNCPSGHSHFRSSRDDVH